MTQTKKTTQSKKEKLDKGNVPFASALYRNNPSDPKENKKFRAGVRRKRNRLIRGILKLNEDKDIKGRNESIKEFNSFYKDTYLKNDYSLESIVGQSSDISTREYIGEFLSFLKKWKIGK